MSDWTDAVSGMNTAMMAAMGQNVLYVHEADAPVAVNVIFHDTRDLATKENPEHARIYGIIADFPQTPVRGDKFTIDDNQYVVWEAQHDGSGLIAMGLHLV